MGNGYGFFAPTSLRQVSPPPGLHDHSNTGSCNYRPQTRNARGQGTLFCRRYKKKYTSAAHFNPYPDVLYTYNFTKDVAGVGGGNGFFSTGRSSDKARQIQQLFGWRIWLVQQRLFNAGATKLVERSG